MLHARRMTGWASLLALLLAACGGGGGGGTAASDAPPGVEGGLLNDPVRYALDANAALPSATESSVQTSQQLSLDGTPIDYQTDTGHLTASDPVSGAAKASMFYVAYTRKGVASANRPLVFFYNGGPGSASVWLHLGSYAPKRLAAPMPATTVPQPYRMVDNPQTLLREADLVFVDAVGTGYSQAIAPNSNRSFWGVDADALLFRDFVLRYTAKFQRQASPLVLFGESYGGLRSPILAAALLAAGAPLQGVVLQSAILNYNSNCAVLDPGRLSCSAFVPSYAAAAAWFQRARPVPTELPSFEQQVIAYAEAQYEPAAQAWLTQRLALAAPIAQQLGDYSGLAASTWQAEPLLYPERFRRLLLPSQLIGRYDARVAAGVNDALASEGDPSSSVLTAAFVSSIAEHLRGNLKYQASVNYRLVNSEVIEQWQWRHDGHELPDAIPDLALAFGLRPTLKLLVIGGYHDLATPFRLTEQDLARLAPQPAGLQLRRYVGGHMTYLDDQVRPALRADLAGFLTSLGGTP